MMQSSNLNDAKENEIFHRMTGCMTIYNSKFYSFSFHKIITFLLVLLITSIYLPFVFSANLIIFLPITAKDGILI